MPGPQGRVQVLLNVLVFGMSAQEALDAPRVCISVGNGTPSSSEAQAHVSLEDGISGSDASTLRGLD